MLSPECDPFKKKKVNGENGTYIESGAYVYSFNSGISLIAKSEYWSIYESVTLCEYKEKVIIKQFSQCIAPHRQQHAYLVGRSACSLTIEVSDALEEKGSLICMEVEPAFNTVNHQMLVEVLRMHGDGVRTVNLMVSHREMRTIYIELNGTKFQ